MTFNDCYRLVFSYAFTTHAYVEYNYPGVVNIYVELDEDTPDEYNLVTIQEAVRTKTPACLLVNVLAPKCDTPLISDSEFTKKGLAVLLTSEKEMLSRPHVVTGTYDVHGLKHVQIRFDSDGELKHVLYTVYKEWKEKGAHAKTD